MVLAIHPWLARARARGGRRTRACAFRVAAILSVRLVEKARKPASPRSHARDGLSDLHARQVRRASESVYYVFNSRVSHIRRVTIPADFHNATRAPVPWRGSAPRDRRRRVFFGARDRSPGPATVSGRVYACPYRSRINACRSLPTAYKPPNPSTIAY